MGGLEGFSSLEQSIEKLYKNHIAGFSFKCTLLEGCVIILGLFPWFRFRCELLFSDIVLIKMIYILPTFTPPIQCNRMLLSNFFRGGCCFELLVREISKSGTHSKVWNSLRIIHREIKTEDNLENNCMYHMDFENKLGPRGGVDKSIFDASHPTKQKGTK